jgi:hypothetical protein
MQEAIECFSFVLPPQTYLPHTTMRMPNLPPLFLQPRHWWLNPLRLLPRSLLSSLLSRRLRRFGESVLPASCDARLWEGKGLLLLASDDPHAFRLFPWVSALAGRFPGLRMLTLEPMVPYWQALVPGLDVVGMPRPDVWDEAFRQWAAKSLETLISDWCWDLGEGDPLSSALLRLLGSSWRIGRGEGANLSVRLGDPCASKREEMSSLFRTFAWETAPRQAPRRGPVLGVELPVLSPKALPAWLEFVQALGRRQTTQAHAMPDVGATSVPEMPSASELLAMAPQLGWWIGPWNPAAGMLSALGIPVIAWSRRRMEETPSFHRLPADVEVWWDEKRASPEGDEAP